jgi:hypothetical protein
MKHIKYLSYLLRHKLFVLDKCFHTGLYWRGVVHDWHKFLPSEWFPYVEYFYGKKNDGSFDSAWLKHQKRGDHHWQWWILIPDNGKQKAMPMSKKARLEMVCDWCGASKAQGRGGWESVLKWYEKNKHKIILAQETAEWVEDFLTKEATLEILGG